MKLEDLDAVAINWNPAINLETFNIPQNQRARYMGEIYSQVPYHLMTLKNDNRSSRSRQTIEFLDNSEASEELTRASGEIPRYFEIASRLSVEG
mgnify:CR=1 FL=1